MSSDSQQDSNSLPKDSEDFRRVPNSAEAFGEVPKPSETGRTVPNDAEARESHTLTVKEVARMFEEAGVARTERSVVNWCQRDAAGTSRLDSYLDPNERKHFITPSSVDRAIQEELARVGGPKSSGEPLKIRRDETPQMERTEIAELELKIRDLEINSRAKDFFIDQLKEDRQQFVKERLTLVEQLADSGRQVGQLEERLHRLEAPDGQV